MGTSVFYFNDQKVVVFFFCHIVIFTFNVLDSGCFSIIQNDL